MLKSPNNTYCGYIKIVESGGSDYGVYVAHGWLYGRGAENHNTLIKCDPPFDNSRVDAYICFDFDPNGEINEYTYTVCGDLPESVIDDYVETYEQRIIRQYKADMSSDMNINLIKIHND